MHVLSSSSAFLVNAEVDSMGGVIDGGAGVDSKTSRHASIEKARAELRQEFDVREERRRELEFLEKGGNPLDFKLGPATSISVQSTSVTDQHTEHEAKDSFALTPSPHGDSVDSSVRPLVREPTTADNLLLFDGGKDMLHGDGNATYPSRRGHIASSEEFSRPGRSHKGKESEDSAMFRIGVRSQAYARRNRSRSSRDSARACSTNLVPSSHINRSSILPSSCHNSRNVKGSLCETHLDQGHTISSICNSKTAANVVSKTTVSNNKMDMELGAEQGREAVEQKKAGLSGVAEIKEGRHNQLSQMAVEQDHKALSTCSMGEGEQELEGCMPCVAPVNEGNFITAGQLNGISSNVVENDLKDEGQNTRNCFSATVATEGLDSNLSCKKISHSLDENIASNEFLISKKVNGSSNENAKEQKTVFEVTPPMPDPDFVEETESRCVDVQATASDALPSGRKNTSVSDADVKIEEICYGRSDLQNEAEPVTSVVGAQLIQLCDATNSKKTSVCSEPRLPWTSVSFNSERLEVISPVKGSAAAATTELQSGTGNHLQLAKEHEDAILERARTIEASRKRISQLSLGDSHSVKRRKCHWDFVLEEMAWLSNDFMQERIWKITAAAHISHCIASSGRTKFSVETLHRKQKEVAYTLAQAIMQFWNSFEVLQDRENPSSELHDHSSDLFVFGKANGVESVKDTGEPIVSQETSKDIDGNKYKQNLRLPIQRYALRFLRYSKSSDCSVQAQTPMTPDRKSNAQILQLSCEDQYSEENLFYTVPFGAMEEYRNSVSSHWAQNERTGNTMFQDEVETSLFDSVAEFGSRGNVDEEDEGEVGIYYLPRGFEGTNPSKYVQRTKKNWQKLNDARSYELGSDLPYGHCQESKPGSHSLPLTVKRPSSNLHLGSIPTKRVRTAKRQRAVSPFGVGVAGGGQLENKTEASSGDTTSFYEDQTSVHGGSRTRKMSEVESTGDLVKQLPFDTTGKSTKPKKKAAKHLGFRNTLSSNDSAGFMGSVKGSGTFEQRWQLDSMAQHEQNDNLRKRLESHQLESNGNTGMYGHPGAKKPRASKQLPNASLETVTPMSGSIPSPVASQMSNMSNSNKLIKAIAGRDRDRKAKALKMSAGQSAFGNPWSVYEDQALVVLVHDMGPNWELVSDAVNSTLQFKCIFRKPKECKERHKELMDMNAGDGADSAEDSGSSQHYPSTLPGIPKGSARQLLQHLQGPMEEDTLKDHFEKIIRLGQQLHSRRSQNDIQEVKQSTTVHSSHTLALSDVCPNNSNGGFLTPLDLCEGSTSSPDVLSPGYQGLHFSGLAVTNHQGSVAPVLPASGTNPLLQVASGMVLGNGLPSPSATLNGPVREMQRYSMSRPSPLPVDEQQRMRHSSQMLPSRNIMHSSVAVSGALPTGNDHGVHMPSGANGLGMMCGMKRGMAMPRPAFQGIVSPSMINMVPPANGVGMASPVNIHNGSVSGQGNPSMRPREALQMLRPGQSPEDQRQKIQELQMQVTHRNGPGNISYNGSSTAFPNQTGPPVQAFPVHQQQQQMPHQSHVLSNVHQSRLKGTNTSTHQQKYVIHVPKQRHQLQQQRLLQQQQQQFTAPNSSPPQHPISAVPNNNSQLQQSSTQSVPVPLPPVNLQYPLTTSVNTATLQAQQKQHHVPQGLSRSPKTGGAVPNQMLKQRQLQQLQQPSHRPQQRQQSQQQGKLMKGIGKGSMMLNQNLPIDAPRVNGLSPSGIHVPEKGEQPVMHLMQGQGLFPGSGQNAVPSTKQLEPQTSNQVQQQKMLSCPLQPSQKQQSRTLPHLDNNNQGQMQIPPSHAFSASQQPVLTSPLARASQQQQQPHRQTSQQQQAVQRAVQKNCQTWSDAPMQSPGDQAEANSQLTNSTFQTGAIPQCTALNNVPGNPHQSNSDGTEPMSSSSQSGGQVVHGRFLPCSCNITVQLFNWELVILCIFRKPKEYKERHKELMDRNDDDGADSAEDSGSSQHYPSTLPGIPKGSARQLLQHLHGPIEEDTLKGHFEKIIRLGQLLHSRRSQATSQRLSVGMTPKNIRLPNHGEMLLSVHGSPLGVYGEDNMEAIHESEEG
ncbi:hypothetical protein AAC387_Pa05g0466 [Persea americana]